MTAGRRREYVDGIALHLANGVRAVSLRELHGVLAHAMPPNRRCPAAILHRRLALPRHGATDRCGSSALQIARAACRSLTKPWALVILPHLLHIRIPGDKMADPVELTPPTQNFRIFYDPSLTNALANAAKFARTVEADFQTLTRWFAINDGFGPNNRVTVNLIYKDGAGSNNRGYHDDSSTALNLNGAPFGTPVAQIIRMHFVAEFSEVLMDYNNQHGPTTWLAGSSHGEGLSQFCAYMMAPAGYNSFLWAQFREHMAADGRPPQLGGHHRVHRWRRLQLWMCVAVPVLSAYPAQPLHRR